LIFEYRIEQRMLLLLSFLISSARSLSCGDEVKARKYLGTVFTGQPQLAPQMIRLVFHDAIDYNNLETMDETPVLSEGGVDYCLNSPIDRSLSTPEVKHDHNRNVPVGGPPRWLAKSGVTMSLPDFAVLGALVAIEESGRGPQVPFTHGRIQGDCTRAMNCYAKASTCSEDKYLKNSFTATSFDPADHRNIFDKLNFTVEDHTALMGAHSFGKWQVCAGGFNGVEAGPFSTDPNAIDSPVDVQETVDDSEIDENYNTTWKCMSGGCKPRWARKIRQGPWHTQIGFGDGGFFDRTPMDFDNDYFVQLEETQEKYGGFNVSEICCGRNRDGSKCHRGGKRMWNRRKREPITDKNYASPDIGWCRSDRKSRDHLKSLKSFVDAKNFKNFVRKPHHHGYVKRNVLLGADISLLAEEDTYAFVQNFATSQSDFFDSFSKAFTKVIERTDQSLDTCASSTCHRVANGYACDGLKFVFDDFQCPRDDISDSEVSVTYEMSQGRCKNAKNQNLIWKLYSKRSSVEECQDVCTNKNDCNAIVVGGGGRRCWLIEDSAGKAVGGNGWHRAKCYVKQKPEAEVEVEECNLIGGLGNRGIIRCGDEPEKLCCMWKGCTDSLDSFNNVILN